MFRFFVFVFIVSLQFITTKQCFSAEDVDMAALSEARSAWKNIEREYASYRLKVRTEKKIVKDRSGKQILWEAKQEFIRLQSPSHRATERVWLEGSTTRRNIGETIVNCSSDKEIFELMKPANAENYVLLNFLERKSGTEEDESARVPVEPPPIFAQLTPLSQLLATNEGIVEFAREQMSESPSLWRVRWVNPQPILRDDAITLLNATFWLMDESFALHRFEKNYDGTQQTGIQQTGMQVKGQVFYEPSSSGVPLAKEVIIAKKRPGEGDPSTETLHQTFEYELGPVPLSEFTLAHYGLARPTRWRSWYLFALAGFLILVGLGLARKGKKS